MEQSTSCIHGLETGLVEPYSDDIEPQLQQNSLITEVEFTVIFTKLCLSALQMA